MVRAQGQDQRQHGKRLNVGSSNKQWAEMFKSMSYSRSKHVAFPSVLAESEERNPMPKPRWSPRPEQIRLLEDIFNSGMVNPSKEEISKIQAQLQEYGQVANTSVFYWFRNRRSRIKQMNRHQNSATRSAVSCRPLLAHSYSSSASVRSSSNGVQNGGFLDISKNSSGGFVNRNYNTPNYQNNQYLNLQTNQVQIHAPPPNYYPTQQTGAIATGAYGGRQTPDPRFNEIMVGGYGASGSSQLESFSGMSLGNHMIAINPFTSVVTGPNMSVFEDEVQNTLAFMNTNPITTTQTINVPPPAFSYQIPPTSQDQGVGGAGMMGPPRSTATVINWVKVKVSSVVPFNVQKAFGKDAVLFYRSGHPVPTNNQGVTIHPLKNGASYFLKRSPLPRRT